MTVFKAFLKILKASLGIIILYTAILLVFGSLSMQDKTKNTTFSDSLPSIVVINNDPNGIITNNFYKYLDELCNIKDITDENDIKDALFYRDIYLLVTIPNNFTESVLAGSEIPVTIKSTGEYTSSLAEMIVSRYLNALSTYQKEFDDANTIISLLDNTFKQEVKINMTSDIDNTGVNNLANFFSFANYNLIAGCIYVVTIVLLSFNESNIKKRTIISSTNYKTFNLKLLVANSLFALIFWLFNCILAVFIVGDILFSSYGLIALISSFIFTICVLTMSFLIATILNNRNVISGIVNVISLGSSFLCGAFVPVEVLPETVKIIAHIFPSYYYIDCLTIMKTIEVFNISNLKPIIINLGVMLLFTIGFIILTNIISNKKEK